MAGRKVNLLGRKKGRPKKEEDKTGVDNIIDKIVQDGAAKFEKELMGLEGKEFVDRYAQLLEYVKPKLARTEHINEQDSSITLNLISSKNPNLQITEGDVIDISDGD